MSDDFTKNYKTVFDAITPDEQIRRKTQSLMEDIEGSERKKAVPPANGTRRIVHRQAFKRATALAACLCLFAAMVLTTNGLTTTPRVKTPTYTAPLPEVKAPLVVTRTVEEKALMAASYAEVYEMLSAPNEMDAMDAMDAINYQNVLINNWSVNSSLYNNFIRVSAPQSFSGTGKGFALASNSIDGFYSTTNLQVSGVDEADVVKTDGSYIYALRATTYDDTTGEMKTPSEVVVIMARGKDTKPLSRVAAPMPKTFASEDGKSTTTVTVEFADMYISGERLIIIANTTSYTASTEEYQEPVNFAQRISPFSSFRPFYSGAQPWGYGSYSYETTAYIYDISDKTAPALVDSFGQSGMYKSSRLVDGVLYIITNLDVYYKGNPEDTELYIPQLQRGVGSVTNALIPAQDICIMPSEEKNCYNQYTVICAIGVSDELRRLSTKTLLGNTDTLYASGENLLLAGAKYSTKNEYGPFEEIDGMASYSFDGYQEQKKGKEDMRYRHVTQISDNITNLALFRLGGGDVRLHATGQIPGNLLNQFSMDEFEGNFRIVATIDNWTGGFFEDEDGDNAWFEYDEEWRQKRYSVKGWEEDEYAVCGSESEMRYYVTHPQHLNALLGRSLSTNALYVLDGDLKQVGALEGLAEDERVYSVRFAEEIGYFVTYKQVDPLFTVDLSDPTNPHIRSELKIPGFSEYLHPYDDGLLLGLGQNTSTNDRGGESRDGLKLSMFDVSDPDNVTENSVLALPFEWSEASTNHKAVLVSRARALIAFPADGSYAIYGYSPETGFTERAIVEIDEQNWWQGNSRGLFIGNDFYVVSQKAMYIFSVSDFSRLATIAF